MNAIVDNRRRRVGEFLQERLTPGSDLSVVSAYFTIYAYEALRVVLEDAGPTRFLYGEPRSVGTPDPDAGEAKSFRLTEDNGIVPSRVLAQKALARACAAWIERRVEIRTIRQANFLHGKLYHVAHADGGSAALVGSSNFTRRGLGWGAKPNVELNLEVRSAEDREPLIRWFDELWANDGLTRDAKPEVLAALERLGRAYGPEFIYYKTLFHVFEDWLAERGDSDGLPRGHHLHDTEIWKALYEFQQQGATNAINRLQRHNGCIIADSVGLGKTWTALAVIKFFELDNKQVLVLCPKKLEENWVRYTSWANYRNNPFQRDRFNYTVLAHTDLSRYDGRAGVIDLARFNWGAFRLVVIDESHNFRNEGRDRTDETGSVVRHSRYNRLLEAVIKDQVHTQVLMLSATPVNTNLRDLRNQIFLMTEKRRDAFRETLGIHDLQTLFGVAQRQFLQWENERRAGKPVHKNTLIERLGTDFLALLDAVTIARSRDHIRRYYPKVHEDIGGFPQRAKPENLHPPTDSKGTVSYDHLHDRIGDFRLALYMPSQYVRDTSALDAEKRKLHFDQRDRERWLIGMMRVNLLKRLESSAYSFTRTLKRILDKMDELDRRIEAWREHGVGQTFESAPDEDDEDEEFVVGRKQRYRLDDLDVDRWQQDLREDRTTFEKLHQVAQRVTVERDAKLAELEKVLAKKIRRPTTDKDGRRNRKALVFTTFADTARYLYDHVKESRGELGDDVQVALVTGGDGNRSTTGASKLVDVLEQFAPRAQQRKDPGAEIDVLIATDCLSEGQNLQDCDLVVNYDIHWNPVRLMQRFGRIDRLGSRNRQVAMVNFWPTRNLDRYLDLKNRVEARMALVDAAATGLDDPLSGDLDEDRQAAQGELGFRDQQLKRLRQEILDVEETDDGVSMSDLTLDDFLADLLQYLRQNREALAAAPLGVYAIAESKTATDGNADPPPGSIRPGVIFCLKQRTVPAERTPNRLQPYFLVHVADDGAVRYTFRQARQSLALFRTLAAGRPEANAALEDAFDQETEHGQRMEGYDGLLDAALRDIARTFDQAERQQLGRHRGAKLTKASERPAGAENFDLVTWLLIVEKTDTST